MSVRLLLKVFSTVKEAVLIALARCDWWLFGTDEFKVSMVKAYNWCSESSPGIVEPSSLVSVAGSSILNVRYRKLGRNGEYKRAKTRWGPVFVLLYIEHD